MEGQGQTTEQGEVDELKRAIALLQQELNGNSGESGQPMHQGATEALASPNATAASNELRHRRLQKLQAEGNQGNLSSAAPGGAAANETKAHDN
jgi:hypothetical protein